MATAQQTTSQKRERQILVNGKREYFSNDVHEYLSEFTTKRGYPSMARSIEYLVRCIKDYFPPIEKVSIKDSEKQ